jgi:DNA-binding transcriptional ArsR family regulator
METWLSLTDMEQMQRNAAAASALLKGLANPHRLQILCILAVAELSVSELNEKVALSQSALSQHLKRLREDGLVSTRRESQTIYYSMTDPDALGIIQALHKIYCIR